MVFLIIIEAYLLEKDDEYIMKLFFPWIIRRSGSNTIVL